MKDIKNLVLSLIALLLLLSCGGCGGNATPEPTPTPEPEPEPVPETSLTVTVRSTGAELTSFDTDYKAVDEILVIKSNKNWTAESTADWVRIEKGTGVLSNLVLDWNITGKERKATLTVKTEDNAKTLTIPVTQGFTDKIAKSDFRDMILLEYDRSEADYRGYLLYNKDRRVQWLFDAVCVGSGRYDGKSIGEAEGNVHLDKEMTVNYMNEYFEDGKFLSKIDKVISDIKPSVPGKFVPRKIVLTIPLIVSEDWGELDGVELHPSNESEEGRADRVTIAKWFVDECLKKFAGKDYGNLQLIGFYWHEENGRIWEENGIKIADHIHSYGLNFYWVPWFNAYNNTRWKDYRFDAAWLQPNYLFYEDQYPDKSQLYKAYDKATANGMYLEMELDNLRKLQRQIEYWDVYEEKGVLENWPLVYYENGSMFPSRENISDPDWKAFHQRMAKDIADRQKRFYNYE
jgi:hypothetical protein